MCQVSVETSSSSKPAFRVRDHSVTPQADRTPAATPLGSNTRVVEQMLNAATPSGSNETSIKATTGLTPGGSQLVDQERPHAATTLKGSQPVFRVSDPSVTPQADRTPAPAPQTTTNHLTFSTKQHS